MKLKRITEVHWKIKVGGKYYGDFVTLTDKLNPDYTKKAILREVRTTIEETMEILTEQAVLSIQEVITGKDETSLLLSRFDKELLKGGKK